jgi:hypothetical protein
MVSRFEAGDFCGGRELKIEIPTLTIVLVLIALCLPAVAGERDLLATLATEVIEGARINLNPWGPRLGVEIDIDGNDPGMASLVSVISNAEPGQGHKCANRGAIRFRMKGGEVVAVGLLPSHAEGFYEFRLYDGDRLAGVCRVQRAALLAALEGLGVPVDDPAFPD